MKLKKKIVFIVFLLTLINFKSYSKNNIFIAYKVENEIITNIDIENESKYLIALNNQLQNIDKNKILVIARKSIIKEKIKEIEILKYYKLDQKNPFLKTIIKDFYVRLNLNNELEFENYLTKYDLTIEKVLKKIEIETTWNQLILEKYRNKININLESLKKKISKKKKSKKKISYLLSEIVFEKEKNQSIDEIVKKINISIDEIGFKNTANLYSISDSAKFGGNVGWVEKENLIKKIYKLIIKLKIGKNTKAIQVGNNFLIIKVEDIKESIIKIDVDKELKKIASYEQDRQLNQF